MQFHMIGIDPARFGRGALRLSANVTAAENYYQQNPAYNLREGGNSFKGTPLASDYIHVSNYDYTGNPAYTHETIVERVTPLILGEGQ
jgi:hypothetical protein